MSRGGEDDENFARTAILLPNYVHWEVADSCARLLRFVPWKQLNVVQLKIFLNYLPKLLMCLLVHNERSKVNLFIAFVLDSPMRVTPGFL